MSQRNPTEPFARNAHTRARVMSVSYQRFRTVPLKHGMRVFGIDHALKKDQWFDESRRLALGVRRALAGLSPLFAKAVAANGETPHNAERRLATPWLLMQELRRPYN